MPKFRIFYSWQSDLPSDKTRDFIRKCIDDAIQFAEESEAIEAERDEATKGTTGSPNIVTTVFEKIDSCDLFIADLSLCFTQDEIANWESKTQLKHSPNPNVLVELGYAVKTLGWERIICLCNADHGDDYPFDIAQNRRTPYYLEGRDADKECRRLARIILSNIQGLKGQVPRGKAYKACHIVGTYDYNQKKVVGALKPIEIGKGESYELHDKCLVKESQQLVSEIQVLTSMIMADKTENERKITDSDESSQGKVFKDRKITQALYGPLKMSERDIVWDGVDADKERLRRLLGMDVSDEFFDLGKLKKVVYSISNLDGENQGSDEEIAKYDKLQQLSYKLETIDIRRKYVKTFNGLSFIRLSIQNTSELRDTDIHIVVRVETGEPVEPLAELICSECEGLFDEICRDDENGNDIGVLGELFLQEEDGVIHYKDEPEALLGNTIHYPTFDLPGFSQRGKTNKDYEEELQVYIAKTSGKRYYEYTVKSLNPKECCWLSPGMLVKPADNTLVLSYRITSANSTGELSGTLVLNLNGQ